MKKLLVLSALGMLAVTQSANASIYVGIGGAPAPAYAAPVYAAPQPAYVAQPVYPAYVGGYYHHNHYNDRHHDYDWGRWHGNGHYHDHR